MKITKYSSIVILIVGITTFFHLYDFGLPALWADETSFFITSAPILYPVGSEMYNLGTSLWPHYGPFHIQFAAYVSGLSSYFSLPFSAIFGMGITTIRLYNMVIAISIIILTYYAGKEIHSKKVGIIAISLLSMLPVFIFYSRQSVTYEWSLICFGLLIIIFGSRFVKTRKKRYLIGSVALAPLGIFNYMWFLWKVIAFTPAVIITGKKLFFDKEKNENKISKKNIVILAIISLLVASVPLIVQSSVMGDQSMISFILQTTSGESQYLQKDNSDFINNFSQRINHFVEILSKPSLGLYFANISIQKTAEDNLIYPILFIITSIITIGHVICKKENYKKILSLQLFLMLFIAISSFSSSSFSVMHMSFILPYIAIQSGVGLVVIFENEKIKRIFKNTKNSTLFLIMIIVIVTGYQIPAIIANYDTMENDPTSGVEESFNELVKYIENNEFESMALSWYVWKLLPIYSGGEIAPIPVKQSYIGPAMEFGDNITPNSLQNLESIVSIDSDKIFISYIFPSMPNCEPIPKTNSGDSHYKCAQFLLMSQSAERNNKKLEVKDFPLPDGTPYIRTYRIMDLQ
jgi:4-amino-4-deoxy-L-arabinose transferase-like glycosyltransferase